MREDVPVPRTLVFFHAHPDDESLLTAGTMARAAAEGHRVVLLVATAGEAGLASSSVHSRGNLGRIRLDELHRSAAALGVARVECLEYADSGLHGDAVATAGHTTWVNAEPAESTERVASLLAEERADVLTVYDAAGGYGHPDHVRVHEIGIAAGRHAQTPRIFEATLPREPLARAVRLLGKVHRFPPEFDPTTFGRAFTASRDITHRVDVRRHVDAKRASMAAHSSQSTTDDGDRTLAAFLRLPKPIFRSLFATEYFTLVRNEV